MQIKSQEESAGKQDKHTNHVAKKVDYLPIRVAIINIQSFKIAVITNNK